MKLIDWFKQLIKTYNKGKGYDDLVEESIKTHNSLQTKIIELNSQNKLLKDQIKKLLSSDQIDILSVKDYYEKKYGLDSWKYNFSGKGLKDVKYSLRTTSEGRKKLVAAAKELINTYGMHESMHPSQVVENVIKYFKKRSAWTYVYDKNQFHLIDYWELAEKSWETRRGDCDDLAILMHNIIYFIFQELDMSEYYWRLKLCAGNTLVEGHAFNIWLGSDGEWYAVESTLDLIGSYSKTWLKTPIRNNNLYKDFWGFARKDRSWRGNAKSLLPYKEEADQ